jgi:hypothetical protein
VTEEPPRDASLDSAAAEEGLLETTVSVVTEPVPTLRRLTRRPRIGWAVVVTLVVGALSGVVALVAGPSGTRAGFEVTPAMDQAFRAIGLAFVVLGPVFGLIGLALGAGVLQVSSYLLGGRGGYAGLFTALGFAQVPQVFGIPVGALARLAGGPVLVLSGVVSFGLWLWSVVLAAVAVRENHDFSTGRAVAALLLPVGALVAFVVVIWIALVAFFAAGLRGAAN